MTTFSIGDPRFNQLNALVGAGTINAGTMSDLIKVLNAMDEPYKAKLDQALNAADLTVGNINPATGKPSQHWEVFRFTDGRFSINMSLDAVTTFSKNYWSLGYAMAESLYHESVHVLDPKIWTLNSDTDPALKVSTRVYGEVDAQTGAFNAMSSARMSLISSGQNISATNGGQQLFDPNKPITNFSFTEDVLKFGNLVTSSEYASGLDEYSYADLQRAELWVLMGRSGSAESKGGGYIQQYMNPTGSPRSWSWRNL